MKGPETGDWAVGSLPNLRELLLCFLTLVIGHNSSLYGFDWSQKSFREQGSGFYVPR